MTACHLWGVAGYPCSYRAGFGGLTSSATLLNCTYLGCIIVRSVCVLDLLCSAHARVYCQLGCCGGGSLAEYLSDISHVRRNEEFHRYISLVEWIVYCLELCGG